MTAALVVITGLSWAYLVFLSVQMSEMGSPFAMPMTSAWTGQQILLMWTMWAVMMAAMMLPSTWPMVRTFVDLCARQSQPVRARGFVGAYLLVWSLFSVAATALQWALQAAGWVNPMIVSTSAPLTGTLLLVAGVYQFSPLKRLCLAGCRTPIGFLLGEWRGGRFGGFVMGWRHGLFCLGCCWVLMALLFVGGVMNLAWIAALSIAVAIEKLAPHGGRVAVLLGLGLIGAGSLKLLALAA